jgi:ATP-dependent Lon protease
VGPPGVGKTSLARSIARATGRRFVRQALGGVRDEAEIRGHRRTYIGALPGKVLQSIRKAGSSNPVFLLDEVDKMSMDFRGDPSAALLEVLDPEQNHTFNDHYLEMDFDLSHVMFICTANTVEGVPPALVDRLEILHIAGYTEVEKLAIARRYLWPKQMVANGIGSEHLALTREAVQAIIRSYTKEAGVRNLEREIATVCRKVARRVVEEGNGFHAQITAANVGGLLGVPRYLHHTVEDTDLVGLVHGLAVTPWGGETLQIEVAVVPGKGTLVLTGLLGDWLKESATAAFTYVRSRADRLGIAPDFHEKNDFHVHYPGNAVRTDGPSAGVAMATALVSALTGIPVRRDVAMTGEISLRGRVLPIGGLKEKTLAAHRQGIARVLVPDRNLKDLPEIPKAVRDALEIVAVAHMDDVLRLALVLDDPDLLFRRGGVFEGAPTDPGVRV